MLGLLVSTAGPEGGRGTLTLAETPERLGLGALGPSRTQLVEGFWGSPQFSSSLLELSCFTIQGCLLD